MNRAAKRNARSSQAVGTLSNLSPTTVYDTYWRFAAERQNVFFRRMDGQIAPFTSDPILTKYKFTNAYRASDRVSQFLIRSVIGGCEADAQDTFFRILLFKLFNKIDTWTLLERKLGPLHRRTFNVEHYTRTLQAVMDRGAAIYSSAYIMPCAGSASVGRRKHETHLHLLSAMLARSAPERIRDARSMKDAFCVLQEFSMMGDFLAYQFITDLNYSNLTDFSEMEFVIPGPGARDGLRKCFGAFEAKEADVIRFVADCQEQEFERRGIDFRSLWGRRLQLIDCQNLFCEVDKYSRVAHPDVSGFSGRTRIKQTFRGNAEPIHYCYPTKWGLNERVRESLSSGGRFS